jgi:hypothetical protein
MGRFQRGSKRWRDRWKERRVAVDYKRHRWPISHNGVLIGSIELLGNAFVARTISGAAVGQFNSLTDARVALQGRSTRP